MGQDVCFHHSYMTENFKMQWPGFQMSSNMLATAPHPRTLTMEAAFPQGRPHSHRGDCRQTSPHPTPAQSLPLVTGDSGPSGLDAVAHGVGP